MRKIFNGIISDINYLSDVFISISLAKYIFKGKNRNPTLIKSYRRIQVCVLSHKMVQRLVEDQCTEVVQEQAASNQWGFRKGVSFLQCPLVRESLTKLAIESRTPLYCVAADVASAFSRTNRICQMFESSAQGEHGKLFLFTTNFFKNTDVILSCNNQMSARFSEHQGASQGSVRGPGLWAVYSVPMSKSMENAGIGAKY